MPRIGILIGAVCGASKSDTNRKQPFGVIVQHSKEQWICGLEKGEKVLMASELFITALQCAFIGMNKLLDASMNAF